MIAALIVSAVYLGGAGVDDCDDITFDRIGFAYLACHSSSEGFTGADKKDIDAYVVKFDPRASKIVYATRLGGSSWDAAFRVVVDARGKVWVSGTTQSADFPFKNHQHTQPSRSSINAFVARLDGEGRIEDVAMIEDATGEGLVVTPDGTAYLAGTKAPDDVKHYAFVAAIREQSGPHVIILGPGTASGIAVNKRGILFAVGFNGHGAFLARVLVSGWKLSVVRSIGSADGDRARAVVLDRSGRPHVLGTASSDLCTQGRVAGMSDVFIAGFDSKLRLRYCKLFGGSGKDMAGFNGGSLKVDSRDDLWLSGMTRSPDLKAQGRYAGGDDGFAAAFTADGRRVRHAVYFGGDGSDFLEGIAIDPDGGIWATGLTSSRSLATPGHHGGGTDAILVRLANTSR